jgi:hypothetical protein
LKILRLKLGVYWASKEGVKGVGMCEPFPNADYGSDLEIPLRIPRLLTGSLPMNGRANLLVFFLGLPPTMDMVVLEKNRLRMLVPGVLTAT